MTPFAEIWAGGADLMAGELSDRLISIEVRDEAEDKSDSVSITLDDRARASDGAVIGIPLIGTVVSVVMGYRETGGAFMGTYKIDDISVQGGPAQMTVTGRSADMPKSFRTPRTKSYHQMTFGAIMSEIAGRNGYSPRIDPALSGIVVRHIDQNNESDMSFATRLAGMYDAVARPADGKLAAAKKGTGKAITGEQLPTIILAEPDLEPGWTFNYSARDEPGEASGLDGDGGSDQAAAGNAGISQAAQAAGVGADTSATAPGEAGGVRACWYDIRTGEKKEVTSGSEPFHDLRYTFHNESEAQAAADEYRNASARGNASWSGTTGGDPKIQAEAVLILSNIRPYIPALWRIKSVTHKFDASSGFTSAINAELFKQSQSNVAGSVKKTTPTDDDKIDPGAPEEANSGEAPDDEFIIDLPDEE